MGLTIHYSLQARGSDAQARKIVNALHQTAQNLPFKELGEILDLSGDPKCGGVANFLQCHLTVIAMLDRAKELGCLEEVSDEGDFWQKRDLKALVQEIGSWNEMIAAFGGRLKDLVGDGPLGVQSPITQYPDFEQLEAAGQDNLPPGYDQLVRLIRRVGRTMNPERAAA